MVQPGHGSGQVQPEARTIARRRVARHGAKAREGLDGPRAFVRRDAGTLVRDGDQLAMVGLPGPQAHLAAGMGELERVVDQVGHGLCQQLAMAQHAAAGLAFNGQIDALLLGLRLVELAQLAQHRVERHRLGTRAHRAAFCLGDLQQRGQYALHVVDVVQHQRQRVPLRAGVGLRRGWRTSQHLLDPQAHPVHRTAQIVRRTVQ